MTKLFKERSTSSPISRARGTNEQEADHGLSVLFAFGMRFSRWDAFVKIMNANDLQIAVTQSDDATILSLSGRVSVDSSPMLRNRLLAVLRSETTPAVIVDLTKSPSVDCSGIATLIEALKIARNHQVALRMTGLQGRLKNLFEVTGVLSLFEGSSTHKRSSTSKVF